jgi:hypothetical protein
VLFVFTGGFRALSNRNPFKPLDRLDFEKEDVCEVIFSHKKTVKACRLFIEWLKTSGGEYNRSELGQFVRDLANGGVQGGFAYKRSNFYRTILRKLMAFGFISLQAQYDSSAKSKRKVRYAYAPIHQPIPKRTPLGRRSFWRLTWNVAKQQSEELGA